MDDAAARRERALREQLRREAQRRRHEETQRRRLEAERKAQGRNADLKKQVRRLSTVLRTVLRAEPPTVEMLRRAVPPIERLPGDEPPQPPRLPDFEPRRLGLLHRFGSRRRAVEAETRARFDAAHAEYKRRKAENEARHERRVARLTAEHERHVHELAEMAQAGHPEAVPVLAAELLHLVEPLRSMLRGVGGAYRPGMRELILDVGLPGRGIVPPASRWVATSPWRSVRAIDRTAAEVTALHDEVLGQLCLAALATCFRAFDPVVVDTVTINGHDEARTASVTTTRTAFAALHHDGSDPVPEVWTRRLGLVVTSR